MENMGRKERSPSQATTRQSVPGWFLLVSVFVTGAAVLAIEIMGTRLLAPFFGSGIYTWSALLAITLAALALGYAAGGRLVDRAPKATALYSLCLGAGLWTVITPWLAGPLASSLMRLPDLRLGVLASGTLLFFPSLLLLGGVSVCAIRLLTKKQEEVGSTSGSIFAVSTLGSVFGALATGFFLIPNLGVRAGFSICGLLLLVIAALGYWRSARGMYSVLVLLALAASLYVMGRKPREPDPGIELIDSAPSFYGHLQVATKGQVKMLLCDGIGQNYVVDQDRYTTPYVDFLSVLPRLLTGARSPPETGVVIGLGAGQLPMLLQREGMEIEVVEIDPRVAEMAEKHFSFDFPPAKLHFTDGRVFLSRAQKVYDYILIDAFSADLMPWHLFSREAFSLARQRMSR